MDCLPQQLIIAFLLRFRKIDLDDVEVLKDMYFKDNVTENIRIDYKLDEESSTYLKNVAGDLAINIVGNMDFKLYVLSKIKILKRIPEFLVGSHFPKEVLGVIDQLVSDDYVEYSLANDEKYENFRVLKILPKGEIYLFYNKNLSDIIKFKDELNKNNYMNDDEIIWEFLEYQNLNQDTKKILTIDNFEEFSYIYDIKIERSPKKIEFQKIKKKIS